MRLAPKELSPATRRFLLVLGVLLAGVVACNILVGLAARNSQRQQLLRRLAELKEPVDCLFIGNSLVEAGVDTQVLETTWRVSDPPPASVNLALGATSPVEHALILKHAVSQAIHPRLIVYGFMDDQLFSEPSAAWDDLVGNRALSCRFPREAAELYAPGSWSKYAQLKVTGAVPMLGERSSLWGKVESLRRGLEGIGMPDEKFNRFGRVQNFQGLEAKDGPAFEARLRQTLAQAPKFSRAVQQIVQLANRNHARLVLVEMPMPSHHRRTFYESAQWKRLQNRISALALRENIAYVSAIDWVRDDAAFEDAVHLSRQGATVFSRQLAAVIEPMLKEPRVVLSNADAAGRSVSPSASEVSSPE